MRDTYFTSPATGVEYFIDPAGIATPVQDDFFDEAPDAPVFVSPYRPDWND